MQFPNRQILDGATSAVKEDVLEVQLERRIRDCKVDAEHVIVCVSQAQLPDCNRTQERCIDLVDINNEPSCRAFHQIQQRKTWETANCVNQSASKQANRRNKLAKRNQLFRGN